MGASQQLTSGTNGGDYEAPYVTPQLWSKLIKACAQRRDFYPDAFNLLREMEAAGVIPTARTYHSCLPSRNKAVSVAKNPEHSDLDDCNLTSNADKRVIAWSIKPALMTRHAAGTYSSLLEVAARRQDAVAAERLWNIMTEDGARPPAGLRDYTTMLAAYRGSIQRYRVIATILRWLTGVPPTILKCLEF